ncbi:MAG: hypothetical protein NZ899_12460 [Thermoguttaceae bacterium]|nr:hypothetical protein [Thermoguttaceae bacterium]MDW8078473.1 hypothetical protein [Thermoguttaceae bacterium]
MCDGPRQELAFPKSRVDVRADVVNDRSVSAIYHKAALPLLTVNAEKLRAAPKPKLE